MLITAVANAQKHPEDKNHVIILIDRSAEMEPERGERIWDDVFRHLQTICFESSDGKRPLLIPNHDYLSILSFGKNDESTLDNYITTGSFGYAFKQNFTNQSLRNLKNDIGMLGWRERNGGFFCFKNAYYSIAIPYAIRSLGKKHNGEKLNKTYVILITDRMLNIGAYEDSEIQSEGKAVINEATKVKKELLDAYIPDYEEVYYKEFLRQEDNNPRSGEKYYVNIFSLSPKKQIVFKNFISYKPEVLQLKRNPDGYKGEVKISTTKNPHFDLQKIGIQAVVNDDTVLKDENVVINHPDTLNYVIEIPNTSNASTASIEMNASVAYNNNFYPGTVLTKHQNESLHKQITIILEPKANVVGFIPLGDFLFGLVSHLGFKTQASAVMFINILVVIITLFLFMFVLKQIANRTYKTSPKQFKIKEVEE